MKLSEIEDGQDYAMRNFRDRRLRVKVISRARVNAAGKPTKYPSDPIRVFVEHVNGESFWKQAGHQEWVMPAQLLSTWAEYEPEFLARAARAAADDASEERARRLAPEIRKILELHFGEEAVADAVIDYADGGTVRVPFDLFYNMLRMTPPD